MAAYVMVGFDSAGELSEETHAPRRTTPEDDHPRARRLRASAGCCSCWPACWPRRSLTDGSLASGGLAGVLTARLGGVSGRHPAGRRGHRGVRLHARRPDLGLADDVLDGARAHAAVLRRSLGKVSPRTGTPIATSIVVGVGAAIALVVNWNQSAVFTALASRLHRDALPRLPRRDRAAAGASGSGCAASAASRPASTRTASRCSRSAGGASRSTSSRSSTRSSW